jgi:peptidoglycan/LPS O-acetylase OafA/YrhL
LRYRPEIDGLRAIAVVPVILFHAGFGAFGGGFVGVDIFFVISGYLITSILLAELDRGQFSLLTFYERRARRILPALFFVMLMCLPFAWAWLLPQDMKDFAQSMVAVTTFSSNILFYLESGYFDTAAELKPLLHTWSLAVEEQYYILFPLLLMAGWRLGKPRLILLLGVLAVASLVTAQVTLGGPRPEGAFFLLPSRGWELILGAFTAFHFNRSAAPNPSQQTCQTLSLAGLALIAAAVALFDESIPFPGIAALAPVVGTTLVILYAREGTLVNQLLRQPVLVGIGLISYSAYLWHQPLIAFAKHRVPGEPSMLLMAVLCGATLPLAWFTWRFVESPFRQKSRMSRQAIFAASTAAGTALVAIGVAGHVSDGREQLWLENQPPVTARTYELLREIDEEAASQFDDGDCRFNSPQLSDAEERRLLACHARHGPGVAIIGDSHAIDLYGAVTTTHPDAKFVFGATRGFCRAHDPRPSCPYDEFLAFVEEHRDVFSLVIYEQAAFYLVRNDERRANRRMFTRIPLDEPVAGLYPNVPLIAKVHGYLAELSHYAPVLWFGPRVEPHIDRDDILRLGCDHPFTLRDRQEEVFDALDERIAETVGDAPNFDYLSQNDAFGYRFPEDFMTCDALYWSDGDHLSTDGERRFGERYDLLAHVVR